MAWKLSGKDERPGSNEWTGFLDKGVKLEGKLELVGVFRLDAEVKGTIISKETLILGESAQVEGQIEGNHIVIGGRFNGIIMAKGRVEVQPKGVVTGEVHTPCLVIEPGGILDGRCHMLTQAESAKPLTIPVRAFSQSSGA
jgi:cytoskeletal protein CcmA (bactofilin family)